MVVASTQQWVVADSVELCVTGLAIHLLRLNIVPIKDGYYYSRWSILFPHHITEMQSEPPTLLESQVVNHSTLEVWAMIRNENFLSGKGG